MPRTAWRGCAAAGIVAFICSSSFGRIPGMASCGLDNGLGPIMNFEFARTPADIITLFGSEPCTSTLVAAQKTGLLLDALGFIPFYTAFLILAAIAAGSRRRVQLAMIAIFMVAAVSDQIEGALLYAILRDLPGTPALLGTLWWAVHVKFALLALGTIGIAEIMTRGRRLARLFAGFIAMGGLFALTGLMTMPSSWMMTGFLLAWVTLLIASLIASFWPLPFAAPAAPPPGPVTPSA
jgi:hypothetical protein